MTELIVAEEIKAVQLFDGKSVDPLLEQIRTKALSLVPDVSTAKGRKEIASIAHSVARSKTLLDNAGKELVSGIKEKAKVIDQERKKLRDNLDSLKAEVREPLTVWETEEKERLEKLNNRVVELKSAAQDRDEHGDAYSIEYLCGKFEWLKSVEIDDSFEDMAVDAAKAKDSSLARLEKIIADLQEEEARKAEIERLQKEAEEKKRLEREERLRLEGEKRAREEAEAKAKAEAARVEREKKEKEEAERKERERIEAEKQAAIDAKIEAERKVKEAEERAKREAVEAKERAKKQVEEAARKERERIESEKMAEAAATARREADKKHRANINNSAVSALVAMGISDKDAKMAVTAIATGKVPHVAISY